VGLYDWDRPEWMPASIDNFWLFLAIHYGLPAVFLILVVFFSIFLRLSFRRGLNDRLVAYRTAFLISMTALFLAGWTVHFWDAAYVLFLFLMGSGVLMLEAEPQRRMRITPQDGQAVISKRRAMTRRTALRPANPGQTTRPV
jgi:hypothetical protein